MSHLRKHAAPTEDKEVKYNVIEVQDDVVVPHVNSLPQHWKGYLVEHFRLTQLQDACKAQKAKLEIYTEAIKQELEKKPKPRALFHVDKESEILFGRCSGLRISRRARPEYFGGKRLEEVVLNAIPKVFGDRYQQPELAALGERLMTEILLQRKCPNVYNVEVIVKKESSKSNKRQKKEE